MDLFQVLYQSVSEILLRISFSIIQHPSKHTLKLLALIGTSNIMFNCQDFSRDRILFFFFFFFIILFFKKIFKCKSCGTFYLGINQKISKEAGSFIEILTIGLSDCKKTRKTEYEYEMQDKGSRCSIHGNLNIGFHALYIFLKESKSKMVSLRQLKTDSGRNTCKYGVNSGFWGNMVSIPLACDVVPPAYIVPYW